MGKTLTQLCLTLVVLLYTIASTSGSSHYPIYETNKGNVRGRRIIVRGKELDVFYGIPYAKPPVGELRFRHPLPNDPWGTEALDATIKPNACMQVKDELFKNFSGSEVWNANTQLSEDCLYLNVWVPRTNPPFMNKPVMVWIFGGGFFSGSSALDIYDAKYLAAENDIIVVSMQYRVGSLGFLALYHREVPGNAGMFDQVMALEWVQQNIHHFGGSPQEVTLFGESAGAASVGMHLLSPMSRGKFQRAILQSGGPHAGWAVMPEAEAKRRSSDLATILGCTQDNIPAVVDCLRQVPADLFYRKEWDVIPYGVVRFPFCPIVDGVFLTETPEKSLNTNNYKKCPILLGNTLNEASYWLVYFRHTIFPRNSTARVSRKHFDTLMDNLFDFHPQYPHTLNNFGLDAIKFQYTPWLDPNNQSLNCQAIEAAVGDYHFTCPTVDMAQHYASTGNNVYYYVFKHRSSVHLWAKWMGVLHADEINFVFGEPLDNENRKENRRYKDHEIKFAKKVMKYWTNFAKTGNPNREPGGLSLDEWPLYEPSSRKHLILKSDLINHLDKSKAVGVGPRIQECSFWKYYLPQLTVKTEEYEVKIGMQLPSAGAIRCQAVDMILLVLLQLLLWG